MLKIILPWPPHALWPNAHSLWQARARATLQTHAAAREATILAAWDQGQSSETIDLTRAEIPLEVTFHASTRRRYDKDGAIGACKGYFDGIAEALGVDDHHFSATPHRGEPVPGGQVVIVIR